MNVKSPRRFPPSIVPTTRSPTYVRALCPVPAPLLAFPHHRRLRSTIRGEWALSTRTALATLLVDRTLPGAPDRTLQSMSMAALEAACFAIITLRQVLYDVLGVIGCLASIQVGLRMRSMTEVFTEHQKVEFMQSWGTDG